MGSRSLSKVLVAPSTEQVARAVAAGKDQDNNDDDDEFEGSSAAHSQSVASTITDGASLTGAKNKLEDVLRFFSFQAHNKRLPFGNFANLIYLLEILQTLSFALDPTLFYWGDADRSTLWSDATAPTHILRILRYFHGVLQFETVLFFILAAIAGLHFFAMVTQGLLVWQGALGVRGMYAILKLLDIWSPIVVPLTVSVLVLGLKQDPTTTNGIVSITIGAAALVCTAGDIFHSSI